MAQIPDHIIEQVRDRTDIVEVVGAYLPLKKAGRNYRAPCPFHHEKTPSFMVSQEKQIFHCFGCGVGGNVFNFLMQYERLEFPEAVRALAQRAGIVIPQETGAVSAESSLMNKLYAVNELASAYFQKTLREDRVGRSAYDYLIERGLNEDMIKLFRVGYAASGWENLLGFLRQKGISPEIAQKAGLAIASEKKEGGYFDRFRGRIMFTILDQKSRALGFGGRVFLKDDTGPKYMNSPETQVYNKGRNLYGLNFTWKHIRDEDQVIIVEGYLDLIIPFQYGIKNMVASLGTSLTEGHIRLLRRFTKNVVIIFDPDKAGELATLRSLDLLVEEGLSVSVVRLPEDMDPDSFIKKYGADEFKKRTREAQNLFDYKMSVLCAKYDRSILEEKVKIVEEMLPTVARIQNDVLKSGYIKKLADDLSIDEEAVRQELKKLKPAAKASGIIQAEEQTGPLDAGGPAPDYKKACPSRRLRESEKVLAGILIDDNNFIGIVRERLKIDDFQDPVIKKIIEVLFRHEEGSKSMTAGKLINQVSDIDAQRFIPELVDCVDAVVEKEKTLEDCIIKIKQDKLKDKLNWLQVEIVLAQSKADEERINALIAECNTLLRNIKGYEEKTQKVV